MNNRQQCASCFLMIRPVNFCFNNETADSNVFQFSSKLPINKLKRNIQTEFDNAVKILKAEDVSIDLIDPKIMDDVPDQVFPNNWFQVTHNGLLILFPMYSQKRRNERLLSIIDHIKTTYRIKRVIDLTFHELNNFFLEGTGSVVLDHLSRTAYAVRSTRTSEKIFKKYCNILGYKDVLFNALDPNGIQIYHTNILMSIGPGFSVICSELIPKEEKKIVLNLLKSNNLKIIEIEFSQLENFCGNIITVLARNGEFLVIMSERAKSSFRKDQLKSISNYGRIVSLPIENIEKTGGGGIRCMMAEIFSF